MEIRNRINIITKHNIGDIVYRVTIACKDGKCFWKIKKEKLIEAIDEIFDRLEKGLSCIDKKIDNNDETWGLFFTNKQLKNIFGFTDKEIKNLHKKQKA